MQKHQYQEALQSARSAVECAVREFGEVHPNVPVSYYNLGELHQIVKNREEAERAFQAKSLRVREEQALGAKHPAVDRSYNNQGVPHNLRGAN